MPDMKTPPHSPLGNDPLVGAQFGPYRIIGRIADGERGEIYFAEAPEIQRKVAVKVLREEYCRDQEALKEFHAEIKLIKEIAHDNVAEVFDVGWTTDKRIYIIMERLQGETLQDRLDRGPLSFQEAIILIGQILSALSALHQKGIIHRDLRPDRIFLCPRPDGPPKVKLLGFGISRLINLDDLRKRLPKLSATSAAAVAAHYLSPEQIVNKPVDARTDLFALGIILYETFAGQLPFAGVGVVQVLAKQAQGQIPPLPELDPALQVPPEMRDVIAKATKRDPADRFADAGRLLNILGDLANSRGIPILPPASKTRAAVSSSYQLNPSSQVPVVAPATYQTPLPGQLQSVHHTQHSTQPGGYQSPNLHQPQYQNQPAYPSYPNSPPSGQSQIPPTNYMTPAPGNPQNPPMNYTTPAPGQQSVPSMQNNPPMGGYPPPQSTSPSQSYQYPQQNNALQSAPPGGYAPPISPQGYQANPYQQQNQPVYPNQDPHYISSNFPANANPPSGNFPVNANPPSGNFPANVNSPSGNFLPTPAVAQQAPSGKHPEVTPPVANANTAMQQWGGPTKKSGGSGWVLGLIAILAVGGFFVLKGSSNTTDKTTKTTSKGAAKDAFSADKIEARCFPIVRKALDSTKPVVKARAVEVLGTLQDADRISELRARITDKDPNVRGKAAKALAQVNDKAGISKLQELRRTADNSTQVYIDEALLRLGDKEAAKRLVGTLESKDMQVQLRAALALADMGDKAATPTLKKLVKANLANNLALNVQGALARLGDEEALNELTTQLQSSDSAMRVFAAEVLYRAGYNNGQEALNYIFNDKKSPLLLPAARALARPGNKEVETFFVEASFSKNQTINLFVAEGLGSGAEENSSLQRLWEMLDETEDEEQLVAIAGALLQIQSRTKEKLQQSAMQWVNNAIASPEAEVRRQAAEVLATANPSTAEPILEKLLRDPDPQVIAAAARSLGLLGRPSLLKTFEAANPLVAIEVGAALLRNNDPRGNELLAKAFESRDYQLQQSALEAASFAGDSSMSREALSKEGPISFAAALSLATAQDDSGLAFLFEARKRKDDSTQLAAFGLWLLQKPEGESGNPITLLRQLPASLRPFCVRALYKLPSKELLPIVQLAITDADANTRRAALIAMSRVAASEQAAYKPLYIEALLDTAVEVRAAAAFSLLRIEK
jgi:serine/threonine protein kinase/HEAT repeat protein